MPYWQATWPPRSVAVHGGGAEAKGHAFGYRGRSQRRVLKECAAHLKRIQTTECISCMRHRRRTGHRLPPKCPSRPGNHVQAVLISTTAHHKTLSLQANDLRTGLLGSTIHWPGDGACGFRKRWWKRGRVTDDLALCKNGVSQVQ